MPSIRRVIPVLAIGLAVAMPCLGQADAASEPEITVREEPDRTLREYRLDDALYAIEVRPAQGAAYFLVDRHGDGNFERHEGDGVEAPDWVHDTR